MYNSRRKTVPEEAVHCHEQDRNLTQGVFMPGIGGVQQLDQMEDTNHKEHTEQWLC
jgi:hypothetical protein